MRETKVNYKPVSWGKPYQCGDSWRQDVVVEVTTIGRNGKSRTETFEVTVPVEKIDGAIRWSVRQLSREIRLTVGGALLPDAMAARKSTASLDSNRKAKQQRRHGIYAYLLNLMYAHGMKMKARDLSKKFPSQGQEVTVIAEKTGREYEIWRETDGGKDTFVQEDVATLKLHTITFKTFRTYCKDAREEISSRQ